MFRKFLVPLIGLTVLFSLGWSRADELSALESASGVDQAIRTELAGRYPGARVQLLGEVRWTRGAPPMNPRDIRILEETARGEARISVSDTAGVKADGWVSFAAWVPSWVAARRIHPGEKLAPNMALAQEVNVATGQAREFRGVILPQQGTISGLEARQTILEGQFFTTTAVQRVPDIRRGDSVTVRVQSGDLVLTTRAIADESAYMDGAVRVTTSKTKRQLVGNLRHDGSVEVNL